MKILTWEEKALLAFYAMPYYFLVFPVDEYLNYKGLWFAILCHIIPVVLAYFCSKNGTAMVFFCRQRADFIYIPDVRLYSERLSYTGLYSLVVRYVSIYTKYTYAAYMVIRNVCEQR